MMAETLEEERTALYADFDAARHHVCQNDSAAKFMKTESEIAEALTVVEKAIDDKEEKTPDGARTQTLEEVRTALYADFNWARNHVCLNDGAAGFMKAGSRIAKALAVVEKAIDDKEAKTPESSTTQALEEVRTALNVYLDIAHTHIYQDDSAAKFMEAKSEVTEALTVVEKAIGDKEKAALEEEMAAAVKEMQRIIAESPAPLSPARDNPYNPGSAAASAKLGPRRISCVI